MTSALANGRITALASDRAIHQAFSWMHLHEQQLRRWHHEFLAIPAPPFGEAARARWFAARFSELGLTNVHIDGVGNALGILCSRQVAAENGASCPENDGPAVLLSAHLDTVFPAGTECTPHEREGRLHCPGATDNGAGLTALLALAAALKHADITPPCTIVVAANVGEEGEGDLRGMRYIFSSGCYAGRIRAALALEGAGAATVVDRALGSRRLRVEITGPGGHSWADADRPSPITALADALATLARQIQPANPRTTLSCGLISGGTSINSIPSEARADLDLRSISTEALDQLEQQVLDALSTAVQTETRRSRAHDTLRLQVRRIGDRTAGELPHDSWLALSLRAVDRHLGIATESRIGSTDANLPLSLGIPALAVGAGGLGGGIHTTDEWFDPSGRAMALRRILLLLLDTCSVAASQFNRAPEG